MEWTEDKGAERVETCNLRRVATCADFCQQLFNSWLHGLLVPAMACVYGADACMMHTATEDSMCTLSPNH